MANIREIFLSSDNYEIVLYILFVCTIVVIILLICLVIFGIKMRKLNKRYKKFMQGDNALTLEETILKQITDINDLRVDISKVNNEINNVKHTQRRTIQKVGINKYNSLREMGGNLSFVLTLLDENNNGCMINAMHTREGCYTYLKQVDNGEVAVQLSEDERKSLTKALSE